jgi:hypothetical protein
MSNAWDERRFVDSEFLISIKISLVSLDLPPEWRYFTLGSKFLKKIAKTFLGHYFTFLGH